MPSQVGHALGVDFGTSHTVAVIRWPDGRARPLLIDGSPLLPSAVYAEPGGALIAGRDAVHSARLDPARYEPNPKRRVDDGTVLLGDREAPVTELITAVLARVAEECRRAIGGVTPTVTLTCPATWGATRRTLLSEAAAGAGLPGARLVAEPVAATTYFARVLGRDVPLGSVVVVHDFGAGTFDASVVVRRASGYEVLAVDGCDDVGGIDVDAALVEHLRSGYESRDPAAWARLDTPSTVEDRRAKRQLWDDVRVAKERLSRAQRADLVLPLLDLEVHVTREELEALARPLLERTVRVTEGLMRWARLAEGSVAGVFLVGGSSRIPLLATLLHRTLGEAPVVIEQPEMVVAEGSILADEALLSTAPAAPGLTAVMHLPSMRAGGDPPSVGDRPAAGAGGGGTARAGSAPAQAGAVGSTAAGEPAATSGSGGPAPAASVGSPDAPVSPGAAPQPGDAARPDGGAQPGNGAQPGSGAQPGAGAQPGSGAQPGGEGLAGAAAPPGAGAEPEPATPVPPTSPAGPVPKPTVGRVIVPGAQPPGRGKIAGSAPVAPTRQLPRVQSRPGNTIPLPPGQRPVPAAPRAPVSTRRPNTAPPRPPARPPARPPVRAYPPADPPRPHFVLRFLRGLFITAFLVAVPVAAGWITYRLARGDL